MIDRLPDDIVVTILSGLKLNDAARAVTIISPRWNHILPNLTSLDFVVSSPVEPHECSDRYARWVTNVLDLHRASFINEFRVCFKLGATHTPNINDWIEFAISKRVKVLELDLTCFDTKCLNNHPYTLTFKIFKRISSNDSVKFLKSLCLKRVNISGKLLELILSQSYSLEDLVIERTNALKYVKLNNSGRRLKHLMIIYCKRLKRLEIDVGDVASFKLGSVQGGSWIDPYVSSFSGIDVLGVDKLELEFLPPDDLCTVVDPMNLVCEGFSSLKNLYFKSMRITRNLIESILTGSQLLERLILEETCISSPCHINLSNNSHSNLKYLSIRGGDIVRSVEIDIEYVSSLRYLCEYASLSNVSSLDDASTSIKLICSSIERAELELRSGRPLKFTAYGQVTDLELVRSTGMSSLTSIYLDNVNVGGAELESLLLKYPLVKELTVMSSNDLVTLNVGETSSYLKHLEINDCINLKELTVQAPNLRSFAFGYNNRIDNAKVIYGSLTSLVDVFLSEECISHLLPRLNMIRCFSSQLSKLSLYLEEMPSRDPVIPTFNNVTYLELTIDELGCKRVLPLRCFAEACPSLQELTVQIFRHCVCYLTLGSDSEQECDEDEDSYTDQSSTTSEECTLEDVQEWFENAVDDDLINKRSTLPQLREFKFFGAFHYSHHIDDEISFVLHIVKYAQNLKKVLFDTIRAEDCNVLKTRQKKAIENLVKVMPSRVAIEILGS